MINILQNLPPELAEELLSLVNEENRESETGKHEALILFVAKHVKKYPELAEIFQLNAGAAVEHYERTGEVLPGVKLTKVTNQEGSNIVELQVLHGKPIAKQ